MHDDKTFFDLIAPTWDSMEVNSTPDKIRAILDLLPVGPGMDILDLGTGTGVLVPYLNERVGIEGTVTGVDFSDGMLSRAVEKYGDFPNVTFVRWDFESAPVQGMYDVVMLYSVYPHLHSPEKTLKALLAHNVKPGGCIVVAFPTDEKFINGIHRHRGSESDMLPPADVLAERFRSWGLHARVLAQSEEAYVVIVDNSVTD